MVLTLNIQHMICLCCIKAVAAILDNMNIAYDKIDIGEVHLSHSITLQQRTAIKSKLHEYGLELMEDKKEILAEKIAAILIEIIHENEELPHINFSEILSNRLCQDYQSLSAIFSKVKGITIQHFIILQKIERVKELITCGQFSLKEISYKLHYSSLAHLSNQFKQITGLTPTSFKNQKLKERLPIDTI